MQSSPVGWEERELTQVLPKIPTSLCVFCHEVISTTNARSAEDVTKRQQQALRTAATHHTTRKRCFPPLTPPSLDIRFSGSEKSSILPKSSSKLAKNDRKSDENSASSSLSLYTSESSDDEVVSDDRPSTSSSLPSCFPYDQPAQTAGLPPDYLSKYSSLQHWLAKRKSLRNAMGSKGDITRWLQNKKKRTPLEERVLALSKPNNQTNEIQEVKCGAAKSDSVLSHSRHDATGRQQSTRLSHTRTVRESLHGQSSAHEVLKSTDRSMTHEIPTGDLMPTVVAHTTSVATDAVNLLLNKNLSHKISESTVESATSELVSVLDDYLKQRRIRLLDLFRCVDISRSGRCSRQDFRYLLKQAKVPLAETQVEQLADSLSVGDNSECVNYSQLVVAMKRQAEMRLFRNPGVDWTSSLTVDISRLSSSLPATEHGGDAAKAAPSVCPDLGGNEKTPCEADKRSYCGRVLKLFRDNVLFGEVKTSSSSAGSDVRALKSTMDADVELARRLEEMRLHDRIEYEATRNAVRRHQLPVEGRALRRGLLTASDRPHSAIDPRRLPSAHMLASSIDNKHSQTPTITHSDSIDSLDKDLEQDECRSATASGSASTTRSWFGLRVTSSKHLHSASSAYDKQSRHDSTLASSADGEEENDETAGERTTVGGAGDRWSTRASGRPSWPRTQHDLLELKRMLWELEEQRARQHAIYWPGRADHVCVYHTEGERGGHAIFERVGQSWYNDDPRYLSNRCHDEAVNGHQWRSFEQQQRRWAWRRTVEYGVAGPSAVYRCVAVNDFVSR